jgi:TolB-like protein/Flp pilus assembly protein TadD
MSFLGELKRRNVIRVGTAYVVAAWLVIQVIETIFPAFGFGSGAVRIAVIVLIITFIPVLVLSWVFEITPEGLKRETELHGSAAQARFSARHLDRMILVLLALALGYFAFDKFVLDPVRDREKIAEARQEGRAEAVVESYGDTSIAVLPFVNLGPDLQQDYFSDGITEEVLNLLARVPGLRVISRTSAFSFKGRDVAVGEIARELGVRYILEGSVRQADDRVRVTTQLIEAASDRHVWSESYERPLENIFAIEDEIAQAVLPAIEYQLTGRPPTAIRTDPAAYSLHLQAAHFFLQRTAGGLEQAVEYASRALDIDPDYAPAWITLASAYINQVNLGARPRHEGYRLAIGAIDRGLELSPDYALAHSARAWVAMSFERDYAAAAAHFRRATALAPNSGVVLGNRAVLAVTLGSLDEARQLTERGIELDPVNSVGYANRADQLIRLGRPVEAEQAAQKALQLSPGMSHAQGNLALAQLLQERPADALVSAQAIENDAARHFVRALAYYAAGDWEAADRELAEMHDRHASDAAYFIGAIHAWRNETEEAFAWLTRAIDEDQSVFGIRTELFLRSLHDDPRWEETLERVGLATRQIENLSL